MKKDIVHFMTVLCIFFPVFQSPAVIQKQKIILDCDLGGDIDDAFAVALVLASPELEVLGITLDHGLTRDRAKIACRMLYETGLEYIPVAAGRQTPSVLGQDTALDRYQPQFYWAKGFEKIKPVGTPAADFIIQNLRKYPHEVILFTVGPLPNIGDVIQKDPEALKMAKAVYSMFGSFYMGYGRDPVPSAEWNVKADVASAKRFVSSGAPVTFAGLDVTTFVKLEMDRRIKLLMRQSPLTDALCGLYALWGRETPTLYDPVAVGMVLWPELFTTRPACVNVVDGGFTVVDEGREPNCRIGVSIQTEEFLNRLMKRFLEQNLARP